MTWHPITLCLWLLDLLSWLIYLFAGGRILAALPGWRPEAHDRCQLRREYRLELAQLQGQWLFGLQGIHLFLLIVAVTSVWPALVPGAMCGMGVMQAMGISGYQAIVWRVAVVGALAVWLLVKNMNASDPEGRCTALAARFLLPAGPLLFAAGLALARALAAVRPDHPVSCCSLVYDHGLSGQAATGVRLLSPGGWMTLALCGWLPVAGWGGFQWRFPLSFRPLVRLVFAVVIFCWVAAAIGALQWGFGNYIYEVLSHPCLWCLFLPEHHLIGFALFGLIVWTAYANMVIFIAGRLAAGHHHLRKAARDRTRRAGLVLLAAPTAFMLLAGVPAILWRIRFGGWM